MGKVCRGCKQEQDEDQFEQYKPDKKHRRNLCYACLYDERRRSFTSSPQKFITRMVSQLRSARKRQDNLFGADLDDKFFHNMYDEQGGKCALSGVQMTWQRSPDRKNDKNISIDRINPDLGYEKSNVQLVCKRVNLMKHTMTELELVDWCKRISSTHSSK